MISKRGYIIYALLIASLFTIGTYFKYNARHEKIPKGCDEFGYLNMAEAMWQNNTFQDHAPRSFLTGLMDTLKQEGVHEQNYVWMMVPHAYHLSSNTNWKVINQYPPGTSYLLSWFPIEWRQKSFPLLTMFLSIFIPLFLGFKYLKAVPLQMLLSVSILAVMIHVIPPFSSQMIRINSQALTFGLLIAVGLTAKKHPLIALFCLVLTANFRVVNLLMLLPLLLFFIPPMWKMIKAKEWKTFFTFNIKSLLVILLAISPYLYYVFNLLGNPFIPTYPTHDTSFGSITGVYFSFKQKWFIAHLVAILLLVILKQLKRLKTQELLAWLSFSIVNYAFFSMHKIQMNYYPFASFFILIGAVIYYFTKVKIDKIQKKYVLVIPLIISIVMCVDGVGRFMRKDHLSFKQLSSVYSPLCNYDIVWGEQLCGSSEYACKNSGFKYDFSTSRARKVAITYLANHKYSQIILCDDVKIDFEKIVEELKTFKIEFEVNSFQEIGRVIIIK